MKTPGHAMTAQAGAVAWQERAAGGVEFQWFDCSREEYERLKDSPLYETRELFAAPPAAVPVETLEGLVARLATHLDQEHHSGRRPTAHQLRTWLTDELTQLIKERSNG